MSLKSKHAGGRRGMRTSARLLCGASLTAVLIALPTAAAAQDANRNWDANGTSSGNGGTGTWSTEPVPASQTWSPNTNGISGPYSIWDNSLLDNAIFGSTAGTVTLATPITVHNITFNSHNYVLTGGTLTLGGTTPTIGGAGNATIASTINGLSGLTKTGTGTLTLSGNNTFANSFDVTGGALVLTGSNTFSGDVDVTGASLTLSGANTFTGNINMTAGTLTVSHASALGNASNQINLSTGAVLNSSVALAGRTVNLLSGESRLQVQAGSAHLTGGGSVLIDGGVTLSDATNDFTGNLRVFVNDATASFTSIANAGLASAVGAGDTIHIQGQNHAAFAGERADDDFFSYTGAGPASTDRKWIIEPQAPSGGPSGEGVFIANSSSNGGKLTLTGNIEGIGTRLAESMGVWAGTGDVDALGVISSNNARPVEFSGGGVSRVITLGTQNTFTGDAKIGEAGGVTVKASLIGNSGQASSLGAGSTILVAGAGVLSYTGAAVTTDRAWTLAGSLLNDGTGAMTLGGAVTVSGTTARLGGSYTGGTNRITGAISGAGGLTMNGSGTWELDADNTFTGVVNVQNGTLRAARTTALSGTTSVRTDGGTLDLNGASLALTTIAGNGGTISLGSGAGLTPSGAVTITNAAAQTYGGAFAGSGALTKRGLGVLTLTGASTLSGPTSVQAGTLKADFSLSGAINNNILSASSAVTLSGGSMLHVKGAAGETNNQTIGGLNIASGANTVRAEVLTGGTLNLNLGAISRTGGTVNFDLMPDGSGNAVLRTSNADGKLGGWAMIDNANFAKVVAGRIVAFDNTDYTNKDDAASWSATEFINDDQNAANTPFFGTVASNVQIAGLRYNANAHSTVTVADDRTLGIDGAILVTPSVNGRFLAITGGRVTGAAGGGTVSVQQNSTSVLTLGSTIVDNGGATGFTKGGTGRVQLGGANTYTGVTTLSQGNLLIGTLANGGSASSIGASSADSANLVLQGGVLQYLGTTDAVTDRGFTLVNAGLGVPSIEVSSGTTVEFQGLVTSTDDQGLTKTGAGRLTLSNGGNDYVGVTTIAGTLSVDNLADGGLASGIGASSAASSNVVLQNGGELEYTGATGSTDRGFTLSAGSGAVDVTQVGTALTIGSTGVVGAGALIKNGAGTLILCGTNSYSGGTTVAAGTLRACSTSAFGTWTMTVNPGATLDLADFDNTVRGINGGGNVALGSATLTTNGTASFSGTIGGTGGLTLSGGTQTMSGCTNAYTGVTQIDGTLVVGCLRNGGIASDVGASPSGSSNLLINGTLRYTGGNVVTDRGFQSGAGTIEVATPGTILEFTGQVTGTSLTKSGTGTLILTGNNTYGGATVISGGTVRAGSNAAFGTSGIRLDGANTTFDLNGFNITADYLHETAAPANRTVDLTTATLTIDSNGGVYSGAIIGTGNLVRAAGGTQTLSGCESSYSGTTTISGASVLQVNCLADGGSNSSIGASGSGAGNLVISGGSSLRYQGTGGSTNRQFTLGTGGGSLYSSGTGAIAFTSTAPVAMAGTNTARTLTLRGTNTGDNRLAALIADNGTGRTALTKTDGGTWVLTNPNSTYTGITTISGGVLGVDKLSNGGFASSIGASSAAATNLVIGNNSTLRYTGVGDTTDRLFTLSAGNTIIESSGTGAIVFTDTGPVTLQTNNAVYVVALGGTNTGNNTLAGSLRNAGTGTTTLAKNDSGTWVLTGNNTFTGNTVINDGNLVIGNGGNTGNAGAGNVIVDKVTSTLSFNRNDAFSFAGTLSGPGSIAQIGTGTTVLTSVGNSIGAARVDDGTLQVDGALQTATMAMNGDGALTVNGTVEGATAGSSLIFTGDAGASMITVNGGGTLRGNGTLGDGGDSVFLAGTLATGGAAFGLGAGADTFTLSDGAAITGTGIDAAAGDDLLVLDNAVALTVASASATGFERLRKDKAGTATLLGDHSFANGTTITAGTLQIGAGGASGSLAGAIANNSVLAFNRTGTLAVSGAISGSGTVNQIGAGVTVLSGANSYAGQTTVSAGTLLVNGSQSLATGATSVASGATLGGSGTIGGNVTIAGGATLSPGNSPGTLTIAGDLFLDPAAQLDFELGEANVAGGTYNDLINVGGDLTLDGTLNITESTGGAFGRGIYRLFNYGGTLTNNLLDIAGAPAGLSIQTSVANQVNLINTQGLVLRYWDGNAGPKDDGVINGGAGTWQASSGNDNWADELGTPNGGYLDSSIPVFQGTAGTVTVDDSLGAINVSGFQFVTSGYVIAGDQINLVEPQTIVRVGDGTPAETGYIATISAPLGGAGQLAKADGGTLVLSGANSYTGGTAVFSGTLRISSDANLGDASGGLSLDGGTLQTTATMASARSVAISSASTVLTNAGTTLTLSGPITGAGMLTKSGTGTLTLTGDATHTGGTVLAGVMRIGNGGATGSIAGDIVNNGTLTFNRTGALGYAGAISGTGVLNLQGGAAYNFTGDSSYSGNTIVNASTLRLDNGGTITSTGTTTLQGLNGNLTVSGAGSSLTTAAITMGLGAASVVSLDVLNGGVVRTTNGSAVAVGSANVPHQATINVDGAGSLLDLAGGLSVAANNGAATFIVNVTNGGALRSSTGNVGPSISALTGGTQAVTISGPESSWTIAGALDFAKGTTSILGGGTLSAASATMGFRSADLIVSGAGSVYSIAGDQTITSASGGLSTVTLAAGGRMSVGGQITLGSTAGSTAVLNIGGAEGQAAAGAGALDAATLVFGPGTGRVNFNHTDAGHTFAAAMSGNGSVHQVAGTTILTGTSSYTGGTTISGGALVVSSDANLGDVTSAVTFDGGLLRNTAAFTTARAAILEAGGGTIQTDADLTWTGTITGAGALTKTGTGSLILTGTNDYAGGTAIDGGTLVVSSDANLGDAAGGLAFDGGTLRNTAAFATVRTATLEAGGGTLQTDADLTWAGTISGAGALAKTGAGALVLTGTNDYAGGTTVGAGTLRIGDGGTSGSILGDVVNDAALVFDRSDDVTFAGLISGTGSLTQAGAGTLTLSGVNSYLGGTTVRTGTLQVSSDANLGDAAGGLTLDDGTLRTSADIASARGVTLFGLASISPDAGTTLALTGDIAGPGSLNMAGGGTLILSGTNSYAGGASVGGGGTLLINGDSSAATAETYVLGATLGGTGRIGGDVVLAGFGTLAPGSNGVGTLTIDGDLRFESSSNRLLVEFGEANAPGSPLNDVVEIGGDLTLDGTVDVALSPGGTFGPGVYRMFNYGGTLTDNGMTVGALPSGTAFVQTAILQQVNLVNTAGLTLNFWDGGAGPKNDGLIQGGNGTWRAGGGENNWSGLDGSLNADYAQNSFAIFQGTGGTVTIDDAGGSVSAAGMQFTANGYVIAGDPLTLTGTTALVRVGDGSAGDSAITTTIGATLTGSAGLVKDLGGTLVLTGANSYTGGTAVEGGTLRISADGNLGDAAGGLSLNGGTLNTTATLTSNRAVTLAGAGTFLTDGSTTLTLGGAIGGGGALTKSGAGTLAIAAANSYAGGTTIAAGTLQIGAGGTSGSIAGDVVNNGALAFDRSDDLLFAGAITGSGSVSQIGAGTTTLTANSSYTGGTTIAAGTLRLGAGGTAGGITGNVLNNGALVFDRSDEVTFAGLISGSGALQQAGAGTTILTGSNSYTGVTTVSAGTLLINGNHSAAVGETIVNLGGTLGGVGTIGGDVSVNDGATLAAGDATGPGTLTINGDLGFIGGSRLAFDFGESNVVGGPLNDLVSIGGDLRLDGTIDVAVSPGGSFDVGVYRVMSYGGALTDNGLAIGSMPAGSAAAVQTAVAGQVNLVNSGGLTLNFWDGQAGPKFNDAVNGGDGVWQNNGGNDNWSEITGGVNAAFTDASFAIFSAAPGTVTIDNGLGAVSASGMQFVSNGYRLTGQELALVGAQSVIRVGDGTAAGLGYTATIDAALTGAAQLVKTDLGTLVLAGANTYTGGTFIDVGTLRISSDANLGDAASLLRLSGGTLHTMANITTARQVDLAGTGTFVTDAGTSLIFTGALTGSGNLTKDGAGILALNDTSNHTGTTTVRAGSLFINGDMSLATGLTSVASGSMLGGSGIIGGDVVVADGGALAPGNSPGTLTINGSLALSAGSVLNFEFGEADAVGGSFNDLVTVGGDLVLDGTINVAIPAGGTFGPGLYRVFDYGGTLTDNGLALGTIPAGDVSAQTAIAGQVNLVNTAGLTLNFWDGDAGPKNNSAVDGGSGTWRVGGGSANWTSASGSLNADYAQDGFAIFAGAPGTITIDDAGGDVLASGLQFATNGYVLQGDALRLTGSEAIVQVGDGSAASAGYAATVASELAGPGGLAKTGAGTLILSGAGSYIGATSVGAGTLLVNGNYAGALGATTVAAGASLGGTGTIGGDVALLDGATLTPGAGGAGTLAIAGDLSLAAGATLAYEFGQAGAAGGALNDLVDIGGNLVLDGTIDVTVPAGGAFDYGVYRVFDYGGALTDRGLALGVMPAGSNVSVQTSIAGQVNLVNALDLAIAFWDGAAGPKGNGMIEGGDGSWQNRNGNDNWTNAEGAVNAAFSDGLFAVFGAAAGTVTIDDSLGAVSAAGMQFAASGYRLTGDELVLTGPQATVRVGDGSTAGAGFTATIDAALSGDAQLVKTDAGTLVLGGTNSYTGGTAINGGTLQIASDANLGAAGGTVTFGGGTLATSATLTSARDFTLAGAGTITPAGGTVFTLSGSITGAGALTTAGAGTLVLTGDSSAYAGSTQVQGTLVVNGSLCGDVNVLAGARLGGAGTICTTVNAGTIATGNSIGTLTVAGDYTGTGGALEVEAELGGDASPSDRLVVTGNTFGSTTVTVLNTGGLGAQTVEGIKIVDVGGSSAGTFTLNGDYQFEGSPAVVAGAFGYRLYQGGVTTPADGDWYLRSALLDSPGEPQAPLYQPGVPLYESYAGTLQKLNGLSTLQERVGNRRWSGFTQGGVGMWGRAEARRYRPTVAVSASGTDVDTDTWGIQAGLDKALQDSSTGTLIAGINARHGSADARVRSRFGNGEIDTVSYGIGATLTWYGSDGLYADAQAQLSWFESDLDSAVLGSLASDSEGSGEAFSLEIGQRLPLGGRLSVTPQAQIVYSNVRFDTFTDPHDAAVSSRDGESLRGRVGLSIDHENSWEQPSGGTVRNHVYGIVNLEYEMLGSTIVDVSGTPLLRRERRLSSELGLGFSHTWNEGRFTLFSEVSANTALSDFGNSNGFKADAGFRMRF